MKIVIINYGAGNSIMFAIERLGFKAVLSNNPDEIKAADKVIFQEWERLVQR
jgi:glutamine amidotransferase